MKITLAPIPHPKGPKQIPTLTEESMRLTAKMAEADALIIQMWADHDVCQIAYRISQLLKAKVTEREIWGARHRLAGTGILGSGEEE